MSLMAVVLCGVAAGGAAGCSDDIDCSSNPASMSLEKYCENFHCPSGTLADALRGLTCVPSATKFPVSPTFPLISVTRGCGLVSIANSGAYGGTEEVYDAATGALVGALQSGDVGYGPCNVNGYVAGAQIDGCGERSFSTCELPTAPDAGVRDGQADR